LSCGALRSTEIIDEIEKEVGKPVVGSNQSMLWNTLRMAGIEDRLEGCAWFFLGSGALIMVLVNGLLLRSTPESSGLQPWGQKDTSRGQNTGIQMSEKRIPLTALFHNSRFWLIGFSYLSISYSLYGITTFMVDYAK